MNKQQNLKYTIENNQIVNRETRIPLNEDMPVFILTAKDKYAIDLLKLYISKITNINHKKSMAGCLDDFIEFKDLFPELIKEPD